MDDGAAFTYGLMFVGMCGAGVLALIRAVRGRPYDRPANGTVRPRAHVWAAVSATGRALAPDEVQSVIEERLVGLMLEFPTMAAEDIVVVLRDELVNQRIYDQRYFWWVTTETVNRLLRSAAIHAARGQY